MSGATPAPFSRRILSAADLDALAFDPASGLLPVVAQDARSGAVLMLAWADRAALERTLVEGTMWYHSRRRGPWHKGATSGNTQRLVSLQGDCDGDAVLARVIPAGPACHSGADSCFGPGALPTLAALDALVAARQAAPADPPGHTDRLLADRNLRLKKLGEEAVEVALAAAAPPDPADAPPDPFAAPPDPAPAPGGSRGSAALAPLTRHEWLSAEGADLLYHLLVACRAEGVGYTDLLDVLEARRAASTGGRRAPGAPGLPRSSR